MRRDLLLLAWIYALGGLACLFLILVVRVASALAS
ncbi:membrane protein [Arthrobacter phage VroomVroom]|uniref:Membrane protein n=1 Tax=Arthrobacter phage VroomVroom TaxID=3049371 RepID=A0AA49FB64_9CAUD|nr:membrane protein [Arthrobacter phage VroomVroom]